MRAKEAARAAAAERAARVDAVATGAPFEELPDLLTVQDICEVTGASAQTVRRMIRGGRLQGCRIGRRLMVAKPVFLAYVKCVGLA